ncbi:MAG: hypothetical protein H7Y30_12285 [Pyrinomonadaceae bacterium]|nr:hypothetical protein [Pyrinomonadaceae bacterium]
MPFRVKDKMRRFTTIFILCVVIFSCLSGNDQHTKAVFPVTASMIEPQQTVSTGWECIDVAGVLGFADISFNATTVVYFYAKPNASVRPAQTLRFYDDKTINSWSFRAEGEKSYPLLNPERHKLDYSLFDLAVKSRLSGWLEVEVDEQTNGTLWLQESRGVRFKNWRQVMKEAFAISRINTGTNPLRTKPYSTAKIININERDCFKFKQMQGDWIRVAQATYCNTDLKSTASGWIRWRDENGCRIVEIFPFA